MNRLAELLRELKNHVGETYSTLDKGSTGKNIRHDANALAKTLKSSFPMLEKDPQYVGTEDLINSGFGVMPLSVSGFGNEYAKKIADKLNSNYGDLLDANLTGNSNKLTLDKLIVDKKLRNQGIGSSFMKDLTQEADKNGLLMALDAAGDFGGNKSRQNALYKKFGFIDNKGRNKDFSISENMYRNPVKKEGLPETAFSKAHALAQKNAALPIEQGGLGLHPDNTAMERARALGFDVDTPVYHGTGADITEFNPLLSDTRRQTGTPQGSIVVTSEPNTANTYANAEHGEWSKNYSDGGNVLPLLINKGKNLELNARHEGYDPNWNDIYSPKYPKIETTNDFALLAKGKKKDSATIKNVKDNAVRSGAIGDTTFIFDPKNIRSRFAAFDPMQKNSANILASLLLGIGLAKDEK